MEQQWEFCQLGLGDWREKQGLRAYDLTIRYMGQGAGERVQLSTAEGKDAKLWSFNPWSRAMIQLGSFGWELVSVQHADSMGGTMPSRLADGGMIVVAYFKRPVSPGRRVDEPKLVLD